MTTIIDTRTEAERRYDAERAGTLYLLPADAQQLAADYAETSSTPTRRWCSGLDDLHILIETMPDGTPAYAVLDVDGKPFIIRVDNPIDHHTCASASGVTFDFTDQIQDSYSPDRMRAMLDFFKSGTCERMCALGQQWDIEWPNEVVDLAVRAALGESGAADVLAVQRADMQDARQASLDLYVQAVREIPRELLEEMRAWPAHDPEPEPVLVAVKAATADERAARLAAERAELSAMWKRPRVEWPMEYRAAGLAVDITKLLDGRKREENLDPARAAGLAGLLEPFVELGRERQIVLLDMWLSNPTIAAALAGTSPAASAVHVNQWSSDDSPAAVYTDFTTGDGLTGVLIGTYGSDKPGVELVIGGTNINERVDQVLTLADVRELRDNLTVLLEDARLIAACTRAEAGAPTVKQAA
jgi:hypothetical protein